MQRIYTESFSAPSWNIELLRVVSTTGCPEWHPQDLGRPLKTQQSGMQVIPEPDIYYNPYEDEALLPHVRVSAAELLPLTSSMVRILPHPSRSQLRNSRNSVIRTRVTCSDILWNSTSFYDEKANLAIPRSIA